MTNAMSGTMESGVATRAEIGDAESWSSAELLLTNLDPPPADLTLAPWQAVVYRRSAG